MCVLQQQYMKLVHRIQSIFSFCESVFAVRENCVSQLEFIISIALLYV